MVWRSDSLDLAEIADQVLKMVARRIEPAAEGDGRDIEAASFKLKDGLVTRVDEFTLEKMGTFQE